VIVAFAATLVALVPVSLSLSQIRLPVRVPLSPAPLSRPWLQVLLLPLLPPPLPSLPVSCLHFVSVIRAARDRN
jgi:hypothetical protein